MSIQGQVSPLHISVFPSDLCATVFHPTPKASRTLSWELARCLPSLLSLSTFLTSADVHSPQEAQPAGHHWVTEKTAPQYLVLPSISYSHQSSHCALLFPPCRKISRPERLDQKEKQTFLHLYGSPLTQCVWNLDSSGEQGAAHISS